MIPISAADVKSAIRCFDAGVRPYPFAQPRIWYLVTSKGRAYPLKYIYAMAIGRQPGTFHTSEPRRVIQGLGFKIKPLPKNLEVESTRGYSASAKSGQYFPDEIPCPETVIEGAKQTVVVNKYERNLAARIKCIEKRGVSCAACHFNFEQTYGSRGAGYIHVHHLKPLGEIGQELQTRSRERLATSLSQLSRHAPPNSSSNINCRTKNHHGGSEEKITWAPGLRR